MSNPFLARFDALAGPRFRAAGSADAGTFRRGYEPTIPMAEVYVDDNVQVFGEQSGVPQLVTTIRLFKRFALPRPLHRDRIDVGAQVFRVESITEEDSSSYVVIVVEERP